MALVSEIKIQGDWLFKYRSYLPVILLIPGLYFFGAADFVNINYTSTLVFAVSLSLVGTCIRAFTVGQSGENTSGRNTSVGQIADSLNTTGIYSLVRHPLYLGNFLMWLGISVLTFHFWFITVFALMYFLYYERIMFAEESFLTDKFGSEYIYWSRSVPPFIPKFGNYIGNKERFNWSKVIIQEKSTWLNLIIVFTVFHIWRDVYRFQGAVETSGSWLVVLIVFLIYYIIIKFLQKRRYLVA